MDRQNVVIIGAGPAGIATAIQLERYGEKPVLLEQTEIGGLLRNANFVENYPGFPEGICGLDLVELFKKHLKNAGVVVHFERALEVKYKDDLFAIKTNRRSIASAIVVLATGTKPREIPGLFISDEIKDRVLYELYPIKGIRNKKIAILGAGDAAFDYALNLSQRNEVILFNRTKRTKCIPLLMNRCMSAENVSYLNGATVDEIHKNGEKLLLTYTLGDSQNRNDIHADYVLVAIGREPCLDLLGCELQKNFIPLIRSQKLYLVGDVRNGIYRQTAICVGDGIKAAMNIYDVLREEEHEGSSQDWA